MFLFFSLFLFLGVTLRTLVVIPIEEGMISAGLCGGASTLDQLAVLACQVTVWSLSCCAEYTVRHPDAGCRPQRYSAQRFPNLSLQCHRASF